jgi:hypothetical protein
MSASEAADRWEKVSVTAFPSRAALAEEFVTLLQGAGRPDRAGVADLMLLVVQPAKDVSSRL